ncbi:hypothetical protein ZWY2020_029810 [Hordeum vulgare]|nr:hypothetical protein ZWY2020_029810 [Hordeum vulgare]
MQMLRDLQRNPGNLNNYLSDPHMLEVFSLMLNVKVQNQNNEASEPKSPAPAPSKSSPPPPHQQQNPSSPRILYWTTPTFSSPMGGSGGCQRVAVDRLFVQRTRDKRGSMEMRNEAVVGAAGRTERWRGMPMARQIRSVEIARLAAHGGLDTARGKSDLC